MTKNQKDTLNLNPIKASLVNLIDQESLDIALIFFDAILENREDANFVFSWFHHAFKQPSAKIKSMVIFISPDKDTERMFKTILIDFLTKFIYNSGCTNIYEDVNQAMNVKSDSLVLGIIDKFDAPYYKKPAKNTRLYCSYMKMKGRILDNSFCPKMNWIGFTNNINCLELSKSSSITDYDDTVFVPVQIRNNIDISRLHANIFTLQTANNFYTCINSYMAIDLINKKYIHDTSFRDRFIYENLTSSKKFAYNLMKQKYPSHVRSVRKYTLYLNLLRVSNDETGKEISYLSKINIYKLYEQFCQDNKYEPCDSCEFFAENQNLFDSDLMDEKGCELCIVN